MRQSRWITGALLVSSVICFILGLIFPIMATKKQVIGLVLTYDEVRLTDSVSMFFGEGEWLMGTLILLFTIIFPILKYTETGVRLLRPSWISEKWGKILKYADRWSMLDVFLVAILLLNANMDSSILVIDLKSGTTFLAMAVVLRMLSGDILWAKRAAKNDK